MREQSLLKKGWVGHVVPVEFSSEGILGGAERYAFELARAMSERYPVKLITFGSTEKKYLWNGLHVERLKATAYPRQSHLHTKTNPFSLFPLLNALRGSRVVFCYQQNVLSSSISALWGLLSRKKVYAIPLGGAGWDISAYVSTDRLYQHVFHISKYSQSVLSRSGSVNGSVIYGGVDEGRFSLQASEDVRKTVLFVGRLLPHKGVDFLIKSLPDDCPAVIVGTRKNQSYYEYLTQLAAGKCVTFREGVSDAELAGLYRQAFCLVLPSVYTDCYGNYSPWTELLGQTVVEAMASGTPAIATKVAAFPEIIDDGENGFLVDERDEVGLRRYINLLRRSPSTVHSIGVKARKKYEEQWTWRAVIGRLEAAIPELSRIV